ncbi:MAG: hypothetical protein HOC21_07690 [Phycisphaerae bacterium]|nr:hypothetical protein [Phycisphaerae bacterium]
MFKEEYENCSDAWLIDDALTNLNKVSEFRMIAGLASAIVVVLFWFIPIIWIKSNKEETWLLEQFFEMPISYILFSLFCLIITIQLWRYGSKYKATAWSEISCLARRLQEARDSEEKLLKEKESLTP